MGDALIECVPNFSEGLDHSVVRALTEAIESVAGAMVLREELDPDHNRSVITFAAPPLAAGEAAFRAIAAAVKRIDLRSHAGAHPRIGAADVVPFVPLSGGTMELCVEIAQALGQRVWTSLGVPVYFYEQAARSHERVRLENVRRGGFEHPRLAPDLGGPALHPSAGACCIGARKFLIAFNVNLKTTDLGVARSIARAVRESSGGLKAVKAMGVRLAASDLVQVSMNLTDFERTPLDVVFDAVRDQAAQQGVEVAGTEIVGLVPRQAIADAASRSPQWRDLDPALILENRLEAAAKAKMKA